MRKILITGANGQLGQILKKNLFANNHVIALASNELDITNKVKVLGAVKQLRPDIIINCASYNKVDDAEVHRELAKSVNEIGVYNLSFATQNTEILLIHISTDYVFDGLKTTPYTELDMPNPVNYYGLSKYGGEKVLQNTCRNYILVRTSWLYSYSENNFVSKLQCLASNRESINVVNDQKGSPTNAYELADNIERLIDIGARGVYHCAGSGESTWYEFAKKIVEFSNLKCLVNGISSEQYNQYAKRPSYSVLDSSKIEHALGRNMNSWENSLERHLKGVELV